MFGPLELSGAMVLINGAGGCVQLWWWHGFGVMGGTLLG